MNLFTAVRAFGLYLAMQSICRSLRFKIEGQASLDQLKTSGQNVIFAVWHQATFVMFFLYRYQKACVVTTPEPRGKVLAKVAAWMGYLNITLPLQSDNLEAARGFIQMLKTIKKGHDAVIAVDGPGGPPFEVKPGIFFLSEKSGIPIIPIGVSAPRKLSLWWRWDRYFIPLPFSTIKIKVGLPLKPPENSRSDLHTQLTSLS